jgi:SAM-dependent methyltransferase
MRNDSYNERIFNRGLRRYVHLGRFNWLGERVARRDPDATSVVELGCYDGRALEHLPKPPLRYVGYDANWEKGLDLGKARWAGHPEFEFRHAEAPADMDLGERFDIGICMETLEHLEDDVVDGYIDALATIIRRRLYVTIPNEKRLPFVAKRLYHLFAGGDQPHTPSELVSAVLGRMDRIQRNGHKGFDYENMIRRIERRFVVESVEGQPIAELPLWVSMGVSIVARPRAS